MNAAMTPQVCVADLRVIEIPNWKKYNPRPDRKNFSWFRLENDFFHDQRIFLLSNEQKLIFLFIICEASKKNSEIVKLSPRYVSGVMRTTPESVDLAFKYLADLQLIKMAEFNTPINPEPAKKKELPSESRQNDGVTPPNGSPTLRYDTLIQEELKGVSNENEKAVTTTADGNLPEKRKAPRGVGSKLPPHPGIGRFIGTYVNAFKTAHGEKSRPELGGKTIGQINGYLSDPGTSLERACNMIQVYCQMDNEWFKKKGHDIGTFLANLSPIGIALDNGHEANGINWSKIEAEMGEKL